MDLRSINKLFLFSSVLQRHNKSSAIELNFTKLFILYAIYRQSKQSHCTISRLDMLLRKSRHTNSRNNLFIQLKAFENAGWVSSEGRNPKHYRLTLEGINTLNDIEKKARTARIER